MSGKSARDRIEDAVERFASLYGGWRGMGRGRRSVASPLYTTRVAVQLARRSVGC